MAIAAGGRRLADQIVGANHAHTDQSLKPSQLQGSNVQKTTRNNKQQETTTSKEERAIVTG
jgi:hypothetical protein